MFNKGSGFILTSSCSIVSLLRRILLLALLLFAVAAPVAASGVDNPEDALDYLKRADMYNSKGLHDQAIADYNTVIALKPQLPEAYMYRGITYFIKKQYDAALSDFTKTIDLNPQEAMAYYFRSALYSAKNQYDLGIADCTKAIALRPNHVDYYVQRALLYFDRADYDLTLADIKKAISIGPVKGEYYNLQGSATREKGQYQEALALYDKALSLNPSLARAYYNKGVTYERMQQFPAALNAYQLFLAQPGAVELAVMSKNAQLRIQSLSSQAAMSTTPSTPAAPATFKPAATGSATAGLRFNGLYQETSYIGQGHYSYHYYRFFADGSVTACSSFSEERPADVYAALEKAPSGRGVCQTENGELKFTLTYPKGNVDYKAVIDGDKLHMKCHSYIINTDGAFDASFIEIK